MAKAVNKTSVSSSWQRGRDALAAGRRTRGPGGLAAGCVWRIANWEMIQPDAKYRTGREVQPLLYVRTYINADSRIGLTRQQIDLTRRAILSAGGARLYGTYRLLVEFAADRAQLQGYLIDHIGQPAGLEIIAGMMGLSGLDADGLADAMEMLESLGLLVQDHLPAVSAPAGQYQAATARTAPGAEESRRPPQQYDRPADRSPVAGQSQPEAATRSDGLAKAAHNGQAGGNVGRPRGPDPGGGGPGGGQGVEGDDRPNSNPYSNSNSHSKANPSAAAEGTASAASRECEEKEKEKRGECEYPASAEKAHAMGDNSQGKAALEAALEAELATAGGTVSAQPAGTSQERQARPGTQSGYRPPETAGEGATPACCSTASPSHPVCENSSSNSGGQDERQDRGLVHKTQAVNRAVGQAPRDGGRGSETGAHASEPATPLPDRPLLPQAEVVCEPNLELWQRLRAMRRYPVTWTEIAADRNGYRFAGAVLAALDGLDGPQRPVKANMAAFANQWAKFARVGLHMTTLLTVCEAVIEFALNKAARKEQAMRGAAKDFNACAVVMQYLQSTVHTAIQSEMCSRSTAGAQAT